MVEEVSGDAKFSSDRRYRYSLIRYLGKGKNKCLFILLNPSEADETKNDPTIRKCVKFVKDWKEFEFGSLQVVNLFAFKTKEKKFLGTVDNPVGPENDRYVLDCAEKADLIVAAWGNGWGNDSKLRKRSSEVLEMLRKKGYRVKLLKLTKKGQPSHPLYLSKKLIPIDF